SGVYFQTPHPNNNRSDCDGKPLTDLSNQDVNNSIIDFVLGSENESSINDVDIYPNPSRSEIHLRLHGFVNDESVIVDIYNATSQLQFRGKFETKRDAVIAVNAIGNAGQYVV